MNPLSPELRMTPDRRERLLSAAIIVALLAALLLAFARWHAHSEAAGRAEWIDACVADGSTDRAGCEARAKAQYGG